MRLPIFVLASALCVTGCGQKKELPSTASLPPAQVHAQPVERTLRPTLENVVGTVRPKLSAAIEAKISGRIENMPVVPGQSVEAGDLLAQLDAHEIQARYEQAQASKDQAEQDWKRISALFEEQAATRAEYDAAEARYRVAQGVAAEAKALLSYVEIHAPFKGTITRKLADVGDLAMPGKPLLQMENPDSLRLEADVPETLLGSIKLGEVLPVRIDAVTNQIEGTIAEIAPTADPGSRTSLVKLDLPDEAGLRSGQFGRVAIPAAMASGIAIPASSVIQRGQMEIVFVVQSSHAQMRLVKSGRQLGDQIEIVSGLNTGESVVTDGASNLADGQPVVIQQ